jgi:hypothetical protein
VTATFVAATLFCFAPVTRAQQGSRVAISIGSDTSMAGSTVVLPLMMENPDNISIRSLTVDLNLPKESVFLATARSSLALETAGGEVAVNRNFDDNKSTDDKKSKAEKITLRITAPRPLPNGKIASLELRVAEKLGNVKEIPLTLSGASITTADQQSSSTKTYDGAITVSETAPTLVNCFFFTH